MRPKTTNPSLVQKHGYAFLLLNSIFTLTLLLFSGEISQMFVELGEARPQTIVFGYIFSAIFTFVGLVLSFGRFEKLNSRVTKLTNTQRLLLAFSLGFVSFVFVVFLPLYIPIYALAGLV